MLVLMLTVVAGPSLSCAELKANGTRLQELVAQAKQDPRMSQDDPRCTKSRSWLKECTRLFVAAAGEYRGDASASAATSQEKFARCLPSAAKILAQLAGACPPAGATRKIADLDNALRELKCK
jgi:hypothetical protein